MSHELGHFLVARRAGIKVLEFAFGIGPKLLGIRGKETLYSVRLFPLGGFVRFLSEEEIQEEDQVSRSELQERSFESKSVWRKLGVIVAGPVMNFVLGAVMFILVFAWFGVPTATNQNVIGTVLDNKPAMAAGLLAGDRIVAVNGMATPNWEALTRQIHSQPGAKLKLTIERANSNKFDLEITPQLDPQSGQGQIGIYPLVVNEKASIGQAIRNGMQQTLDFTKLVVVYLAQMITGKAPVDLSGPVAVAQVIGEGARQGLSSVLSIAGILSIQFGILNILPFPALDGGQLAVIAYEGIRRRPISTRIKGMIQLTGFALLMALMIVVTYNDIVKNFIK